MIETKRLTIKYLATSDAELVAKFQVNNRGIISNVVRGAIHGKTEKRLPSLS